MTNEEYNIINYKPRKCIEKSKIKLNNYQKRAIERLFISDTLILVHSTGTGKTLTSIGISECLIDNKIVNNVIVSTPRVLVDNFYKELNSYGVDTNYHNYYVNTYIKTLNFLDSKKESFLNNSLLIIDEAHNLRTPIKHSMENGVKKLSSGKTALRYIKYAKKFKKIILLTATPLINKAQEFNNLMQIVNQSGKYLSMNKFNLYFVTTNIKKLTSSQKKEINKIKQFSTKNIENLSSIKKGIQQFINEFNDPDLIYNRKIFFGNKLDFYKREIHSDFYPKTTNEDIKIYMSPLYYDLYRKIEMKVIKKLGSLQIFDLQGKNSSSYYISLRKYSNAIDSDGYKIDWIIKRIKKNKKLNLKTLVCSQFISTGINLIKNKLDLDNINYNTITGKTSTKKIKDIVEKFNENKFGILLISKAASEGLDLKEVREVILMEPDWNINNQNQVIGRTIRFKSHYNLPKNEQTVNIVRLFLLKPNNYWTILKTNLKYFSMADTTPAVDAYLFLLGVIKQGIITTFLEDIMKYNKYN